MELVKRRRIPKRIGALLGLAGSRGRRLRAPGAADLGRGRGSLSAQTRCPRPSQLPRRAAASASGPTRPTRPRSTPARLPQTRDRPRVERTRYLRGPRPRSGTPSSPTTRTGRSRRSSPSRPTSRSRPSRPLSRTGSAVLSRRSRATFTACTSASASTRTTRPLRGARGGDGAGAVGRTERGEQQGRLLARVREQDPLPGRGTTRRRWT